MSSQSSSEMPSLGDTFGALFVGSTIAAILFGIMNLQVLIYYKRYPNDWSLYRHSVALFWFLDTVHVVLGTHALYYYLIDMSGNLRGALEANIIWSMRVQLIVKVWTIVFVQGVYAIRLWKLGRHFHKIIPWFVFLAVAASLGAGIFLSNDIYVTPNLASVSIITASIYTFYSMIITADVIIALMMTYYLHKSKAAMHFASTADLLLGLMRMVLASGIATSACSLFSLFTYIMWPKTLIFVAIDFILPRLYINSLLAMFNYRHQRSSNTSTSEDRRHSIPNVLQFAPNPSESHSKETNISIPLSEIQRTRSSAESGISKGTVDSPV